MGVEFNPTMLLLARESRGVSQERLANSLGISQGTLSKLESGQVRPSDEIIVALASTLEYPVSIFYQPFDYRNLPLTFYRKQKTLSKGVIKRIHARIMVRQLRLKRLLDHLEVTPTRIQPIAAKGFTGGVDKVARELRIAWHVPPGPIQNLTALLENAGIVVIPFDFETAKVAGLSIYDRDAGLPPMIFVSDSVPGDRQRWTLAHELAHLLLHNHLDIPPQDEEKQADRFAAEFLMPQAEIRGQLIGLTLQTLASLKLHWKVSMQALIYRAWDLGILSDNGRTRMFALFGRHGYRMQEPIQVEREKPRFVAQIIKAHFQDLHRSEAEVCETALCFSAEFQEIFGTRETGLRLISTN